MSGIVFDPPINEDGIPVTSISARTGTELIDTTINFCDPTTWYPQSERVTEEVLSSGDGLVYELAHQQVIDLTHGKLYDEDAWVESIEHGYSVVVTSDDVALTERAPFATSGGDYVVDYSAGTITFASSQSGKTVKASYSYANGSRYTLTPFPYSVINVEKVYLKLSEDVVMTDTIVYEVWVYNPANLPNKMLYLQTRYKSLSNFMMECVSAKPMMPPLGGSARGVTKQWYVLEPPYKTVRSLPASVGAEVRIYLEKNIPLQGEMASALLSCTVASQ